MTITISTPHGDDELTEFAQFQDAINSKRSAWWPALVPMTLPLLKGEGPEAEGRTVKPFVARQDGEIVARVLAMVDARYLAHWKDSVGHTTMFEALPDTTHAVRSLMDEACGWLREQGLEAARAGFGNNDFPFLFDTDAEDTLPPILLRQNPSYYHTLLKEVGFQSERAWVDYRIAVTPELVERWESCVEAATLRGYRLVPYGQVPDTDRAKQWTETWNESFAKHWGVAPQSVDEHAELAQFLMGFGMGETSMFAFEGDEPVGCVWVVPEFASMMSNRSRDLRGEEKVNFLGIAVREKARGKGVNMAMASAAFLELVRRGATHVSYTLVLDDNWPSRRTGEKLGGSICANYMVYRRNFRR